MFDRWVKLYCDIHCIDKFVCDTILLAVNPKHIALDYSYMYVCERDCTRIAVAYDSISLTT